ncbi:MAG: Crp/Fnr family transcriptional regulator [Planctomycetota bacterium]
MANTFWYIKNCNLFSQLQPSDVAAIEAQSKTRVMKKGETVYLPQDQADAVLLVAQGRVKVCHATPEGKQSIIGFIDSGEIFGELALIGNEKRGEYVETTEKTTLVMMPKQALMQVIYKYPTLVLGVTKLIGMRRQRVERRLRNLLFRSNRERVIHLLLELSEKYGQRTEDGITLNIRLSHQEMACLIGSTRETVTVVLGQLQKENLLKISRRRVTIHDLERLAEEVNEVAPRVMNDLQAREPGFVPRFSGVHNTP